MGGEQERQEANTADSANGIRWWGGRWFLPTVLGVPLLLVVLACCAPVQWFLFGDRRQYAPPLFPQLVQSDGDLEGDILPHYGITLPCEVSKVRYADERPSLVGSEAELWLRFDTSGDCLADFVRSAWRGDVPAAGPVVVGGADVDFGPSGRSPGWTFPAKTRYACFDANAGGHTEVRFYVESRGSRRSVWLHANW